MKDLEATTDSREPSQIIEGIHGILCSIGTKIEDYNKLLECCSSLLRYVVDFINVLESWLKREDATKKEREEKIIRQKEDAAVKEKEEKMIRQKENATKKEREENIVRQKENTTKKELGGRAIRVNYGAAPPKEDFQSRGPRGGGGGSDLFKRLYVGNL